MHWTTLKIICPKILDGLFYGCHFGVLFYQIFQSIKCWFVVMIIVGCIIWKFKWKVVKWLRLSCNKPMDALGFNLNNTLTNDEVDLGIQMIGVLNDAWQVTHSQVPGWTHLRVHQNVVAESWDSKGASGFQL